MVQHNPTGPMQRWPRIAFGLTLVPCVCLAQERPYAFGLHQVFTHDTNVFRVAEGQLRLSDTSSSTGVLGEVVVPAGRQRLYASGNIRENRYRRTGSLDNTSYGIEAGLNWATVERLSGTVSAARSESLATYGLDNQARTTAKNIQTSTQLGAIARMGLVTRLSLEGAVQHRKLEYSAAEYLPLNLEHDQASLGLRHSYDASLTFGAGVRYGRGRYPEFQQVAPGQFSADRYKRRDVDLSTTWLPTGQSTFIGRLSFGRQTHTQATERSFSAATGSVSWDYRPTGKLQLLTTVIRDTGSESGFRDSINNTSPTGNDNSRLSTALQLAARYDVAAKFQMSGAVNRTERSLADTSASGGSAASRAGDDLARVVSVGLKYAPNRNWTLECGVTKEARSTNTSLSYAYDAKTARCSAQFLIY